jgi:hypothetical protein
MSSEYQRAVEAMGPREVIGRAVALLQARHRVNESVAFGMLLRSLSDSHEGVRESAVSVVLRSGEV